MALVQLAIVARYDTIFYRQEYEADFECYRWAQQEHCKAIGYIDEGIFL